MHLRNDEMTATAAIDKIWRDSKQNGCYRADKMK